MALRLALEKGHEVVAVLTSPDDSRGSTAWQLAHESGLEILDPSLVRDPDFAERIVAESIDLLLNVHSLHIADPAVIAAPGIGSFNLHPAPLPEYRGLNSPSWAIYDGRSEHGVTLHWMDAEVDAGHIAYERRFAIGEDETGLKLSSRCAKLGMELVAELLEDAVRGEIPSRPQADVQGIWHGREVPNEGRIDWQEPASRIVAFVRAADFRPLPSPWGWPRSRAGEVEFELTRASVGGEAGEGPPGRVALESGGSVAVAAADRLVTIERIAIEGRRAEPSEVLADGMLLA